MKRSSLNKYILPAIMLIVFETIAIILWLAKRPDVKFCVSDFRQSQEWRWKTGRILAWIP